MAHTKQITLRVVELVEKLPNTHKAQIIGNQLLSSAASIGANYRAACRGRSAQDLLRNLLAVEDEAGKSLYWLEVLVESEIVPKDNLTALSTDLKEIETVTASSIDSLRAKQKRDDKILKF